MAARDRDRRSSSDRSASESSNALRIMSDRARVRARSRTAVLADVLRDAVVARHAPAVRKHAPFAIGRSVTAVFGDPAAVDVFLMV